MYISKLISLSFHLIQHMQEVWSAVVGVECNHRHRSPDIDQVPVRCCHAAAARTHRDGLDYWTGGAVSLDSLAVLHLVADTLA